LRKGRGLDTAPRGPVTPSAENRLPCQSVRVKAQDVTFRGGIVVPSPEAPSLTFQL